MNDTQIALVGLAVVCLAAAIVGVRRAREKRGSARGATLRQNLRMKVMYDEAKIDRLIEFEREELKRKGQRETPVEDLMERAISRWERDNR